MVSLRGGGLRTLTVDGSNLVESYPAGEEPPHCAGAVLFPWPNRVRDGQWSQRGVAHHLPVNEPELGNAAHGLVLGATFTVDSVGPHDVTIGTAVLPQPGYPYAVNLSITYQLTDDGVQVRHEVTNVSSEPAPVSLGGHPYLRIGELATDDLALRIEAETYFPLDKQLIPTVERPVGGSGIDLRTGLPLAGLVLNHCYGRVHVVDGRSRHRLEAPDGRAVVLWADESFRYVQVYTCPAFPRRGRDGHGHQMERAVAVEPMTAPPDALNSGLGLRWLDPGEVWVASWGISLAAGRSMAPIPTDAAGSRHHPN
ncbi:MAG: aldose 1-epimerase family protein [Cellulomonas sp.]